MTAPLSTGSVPLADYIEALRWLKAALDRLVDAEEEIADCAQVAAGDPRGRFFEDYPQAAIQLDLLASIDHARTVKAATPEEYDDARR